MTIKLYLISRSQNENNIFSLFQLDANLKANVFGTKRFVVNLTFVVRSAVSELRRRLHRSKMAVRLGEETYYFPCNNPTPGNTIIKIIIIKTTAFTYNTEVSMSKIVKN